MSALVSTEWLAEHLNDPLVRIADGSFYLPAQKRDADAEYLAQHIPGAVRFDVDHIADTNSSLPHMLPAPEQFAEQVSALGLGSDCRIIAYDGMGLMSAARVWWMFRVFGHDNVAVLDGGLPKWLSENRPVASGPAKPKPRLFMSHFRPEMVRDWRDMLAASNAGSQIIDARSAGRFAGTEPEARAGLRSGHIPGASSLPFNTLLNADQTVLSPADLDKRFRDAGINPTQPIIASCGSGVTACVLALGLYEIGAPDAAVYDGSWTEWGGREDLPIATGA
jgi:thiosulfate/3-mercaptopyruvate sulfurtransferase